jgi:hypothetical protein
MPTVSVAAATAVVGYDLAQDEVWRISGRARVIRNIGVTGSAAAGDSEVELLVGSVLVGNYFNLTTGFPTRDHMVGTGRGGVNVPPGEPITIRVQDAPSSNPLNITIDISE